ncbi:hypothetical protein SMC26_13255 [Actinomadura fulvescens]|uniref:YCII-related domain-containing protein n=1 Tax=Actinomadura fulvescens TaxID=46160 RepID=A0ABN3PNJ2_9ACTN
MVAYVAHIEIAYLGGQTDELAEARRLLAASLTADAALAKAGPTLELRPGNVLVVRGTPHDDDPLRALTSLDEAVCRALTSTGLYEEFDVSQRVLHIAPAALTEPFFAWSEGYPRQRRRLMSRRPRKGGR